jgi:gas vesicle protein
MSTDELKTQFADKLESLQDNTVKKTELDSMLNEIKHAIKDNQDDKKESADEFIDHMTTCNDKSCSIHMMSDEFS